MQSKRIRPLNHNKTPRIIMMYAKRDDFGFGIVHFLFLDGPCSPSYGTYILQLIRFARICSNDNETLFDC